MDEPLGTPRDQLHGTLHMAKRSQDVARVVDLARECPIGITSTLWTDTGLKHCSPCLSSGSFHAQHLLGTIHASEFQPIQ